MKLNNFEFWNQEFPNSPIRRPLTRALPLQSPPRANTTAEFQVSNQNKCTQYIHRWLKWVTRVCPGAQCAQRRTIPTMTTTMTPSREWCIPKRTSSVADCRTPASTSCSSKPSIRCGAVHISDERKERNLKLDYFEGDYAFIYRTTQKRKKLH